jgi:ABC-type bacteriocin/lantibiotic exporter with double-glycine peptidase domain
MRRRLTPPTFPVFIISVILAILAIVSMFTSVPVIGHYLAGQHRFWLMAAAYAVLFIGVVFVGL